VNETFSVASTSTSFTAYTGATSGPTAAYLANLAVVNTENSSATQNLLFWTQTQGRQSVAPEPSSFALAGLGVVGFVGYGVRRRRRASKAQPA
jgi:MYXO-CTERM domain-containing protein